MGLTQIFVMHHMRSGGQQVFGTAVHVFVQHLGTAIAVANHIVIVKNADGMGVVVAPARLNFATIFPLLVAHAVAKISANGHVFHHFFASAQL